MNISEKSKKIFEDRVNKIFNNVEICYHDDFIQISFKDVNRDRIYFSTKDRCVDFVGGSSYRLNELIELNSLLSDFCKFELGTVED